MKIRWRGEFNWYGEKHIVYTNATSHAQAFVFACRQLADRIGIHQRTVYCYFKSKPTGWALKPTEEGEGMELGRAVEKVIIDTVRAEVGNLTKDDLKKIARDVINEKFSLCASEAENAGRTWSLDDDTKLRDSFHEFCCALGINFGRTPGAIRARLKQMLDRIG